MKFLTVSAFVVVLLVVRAATRSTGPLGGIAKRAIDSRNGEDKDDGGSVQSGYNERNDAVLNFIEELERLATTVPVIGGGLSRLASFAYALLRDVERTTNGALDGIVKNLLPCTLSVDGGVSCRGTFAIDNLPRFVLSNLLKFMTGYSSEGPAMNPIVQLLLGSISP